MESETERVSVLRVVGKEEKEIEDTVVREASLSVVVNGQELVTLLCSPVNLEYLAAGFLLSEGLIQRKEDVREILIDKRRGVALVKTDIASNIPARRVLASSGARGAGLSVVKRMTGSLEHKVTLARIFSLAEDFLQRSRVFKTTGGVHSAALYDSETMLVFNDDIGRHNAIDKVFGECLMKGIATDGRLLVTSGRISSEILLKVARRNIPVLISKSAPTDLGVKLAREQGLTLVGFVRGQKLNIYANGWRIDRDGR